MEELQLPEPPVPPDPRDIARWEFTRRSRRLLYGGWKRDLEDRLELEIGHIRRKAWGQPDMSSNVFRSAVSQLACLYDRPPEVRCLPGGEALLDEVERAGWWVLAARVQRDTIGLREMFVHVAVVDGEDGPELSYRPVFPDMVFGVSLAERPEEPVELWEAVLRLKDGNAVWTWDHWSIRNLNAPSFRVMSQDRNTDVSKDYALEGLTGEGYTWRNETGRPYLPFVAYHAAKSGQLFDPYENHELVEGSLNIGVLWTMFRHVVKNCGWPQRYTIGVRLAGARVVDEGTESARREVVADPAVVLEYEPSEEGAASPQVGAFPVGADPVAVQEAVSLYERRVAVAGGISASDVQRVAGDARSGFAIAITTEGRRAAARKFEPLFRVCDERLLRMSALLWNQAMFATNVPEVPTAGYRVQYAAIPPSPDEQSAEREHLLAQLDRGLISKVDVYRKLNPGTTEADALAELAEIERLNAPAGAPTDTAGDSNV